jgi:hypothetical protein
VKTLVLALVLALVALVPGTAAAQSDTITVGLYVPTAPFDSSADRNSFINALADHLEGAADGKKVVGKVFGSAGALATAVKNKEVQFAVLDAPYAAAIGLPYQELAAAVRGGDAKAPWQLVGKGISKLSDLKGKKLAIPGTGAKESAFVTNALLGGEVDASYFDKIVTASDPKSALTLVSVGKADAALVPSGVDIPGGLTKVMSLREVGWPMFVATPSAPADLVKAFGSRVKSFQSGGVFTGFTSADSGGYKSLAGSFGKPSRKGPMAIPPPARLSVREILEGRKFAVPLSDVLSLVEAPPKPDGKGKGK